jgi:pathogenesis-related protein 1
MMKPILLFCALMSALPAQALDFDTNAMVSAHNRWRKTVGAPPLTYAPKLAAESQEWANHLKNSNHCQMTHSKPDGKYGENLFWASAIEWSDGKLELQKISPAKVVDSWASERKDYDYHHNSCAPGKMCGHYTQIVWRASRTVGCAVAVCEDSREQIWVCRYQPPGNWVGEKPY